MMRLLAVSITALLALACSAAVANTPTPFPTARPDNTPTMEAPTPTPTPMPTVSPTPTSTPTPAPTPTVPPAGPVISVGDAQFRIDVSDDAQERSRGLSGRSSLAPGTGMLFVFDEPGAYTFWMIQMKFALDFVWISADCAVVDLTEDAPPQLPEQQPSDLPRYRPNSPVQYVLEINAGVIEARGINLGDSVAFEGDIAGTYGC